MLALATPAPEPLPRSGPLSQQLPAERRAASAAEEVIAAVTQEIGTPILELLLKSLLGQTRCALVHDFWLKVGRGELFDASLSRSYPPSGASGEPPLGHSGGRRRFRPQGWVRCGVRRPDFEETYGDWCVAYHGTNVASLLQILLHGLQRPGNDGVVVRHGQSNSSSGRSIYASPSIEYAAFPCYAMLVQVGPQHWVQFVLECRVRPGSFVERLGTLSSNKHWPEDVAIDPNFAGTDGLEMLLEQPEDIVVSGLLLREFGRASDPTIYGDLAHRVCRSFRGPEFAWSRLRAFHARAGEDLHDREELLAKIGVSDELLEQMRRQEDWWLGLGDGATSPLDPALRGSALWLLSAMVQTACLTTRHAHRAATLLDVLCLRRGAGVVAPRLPGICTVLVRIILKEEKQTFRLPSFEREVSSFTATLAWQNYTFVESNLDSLEVTVLQDLAWRVRLPSANCWLTCFGTRLNAITQGAHLPWVDDAVDWAEQRTNDVTRRQAVSPDLPPRQFAAAILTLGLAANRLLPEHDHFADLLATPGLARHTTPPPQAPDVALDIHHLCEATGMTLSELTAVSIDATAMFSEPAAA